MEFSEKLQSLAPYTPVQDTCSIHLEANESFVPLPAEIRRELADSLMDMKLNRYPDPAAEKARAAFAEFYNLQAEQVVAGNGSDELITILFTAYLSKGDAFATIEPDFSMYGFYGQLCEGRQISIPKEKDFTIAVDRVIETCNNEQVKLLIFSNPCNPTSVGLCREDVRKILRGVHALVILDEAYMDFWDQSLLPEIEAYENLVILKTCSKAFGMAGIRLGFAVAQPALISLLLAAKSPYNVNVFSQTAGSILLRHQEAATAAFAQILQSKAQLETGLRKIVEKTGGFTVINGNTNFAALVMDMPEKLCAYLESQGIAVRFTGGLVRITCGTADENQALLAAVENYFEGGA